MRTLDGESFMGLLGMDSHERAMEINARSLLLYNNVMWPSWEIIKVREYLLKN